MHLIKDSAKNGFILLLTLLIITISIIMVTQLATRSNLQVSYDTTIIAREKAKTVALSGIQLALSQLYIEPEQKKDEKAADQKAAAEKSDPIMQLLYRIIPQLNQWQRYEMKETTDGLDGTIQFSISSEDGKIDINALYDFKKKDFKSPELKKQIQAVFSAIVRYTENKNLFNAFASFLKGRAFAVQDPSELLLDKDFQKIFAGNLFYEPPVPDQKEKRSIFLNDLFTVYAEQQQINPILLSDSMQAVFGLNRSETRASQAQKKEVQELLKNVKKVPTDIATLWNDYLKKLYGKDFKSISKDLLPLLSANLSFRNFTVVSYGTVQQVTQKVVAIIERQERSFIVRKLYWL